MGAKLSKGVGNPFPCLCRLGRKNRVVPIRASRVSELAARRSLQEPADPAIRLGWKSDLVLEDLDSEDETDDMVFPTPAHSLPPVIPPPRVRTAMWAVTEEEQEILATLPNVPIYDDHETPQEKCKIQPPKLHGPHRLPGDECISKRPYTAVNRTSGSTSYRQPYPVYSVETISTELSCQEYDSIVPLDKEYVPDEEESLSDALQDTTSSGFNDDTKDIEDMNDDEINELIRQILSIPDEEFGIQAEKPKLGLVSILKVPSNNNTDKRSTHQRKVRFALK